jgi:hypothetical protein
MKKNKQASKILIFSIFFLSPELAFAQATSLTPSSLRLTMLSVPELEACRPYGYKGNSRNDCLYLTDKDVQRLRQKNGVIVNTQNLPPSSFSLGNRLFAFLDNYQTVPKKSVERRRSIILVFDFGKPQKDLLVKLVRVKESNLRPSKPFTYSRRLQNYQWFIYHESASSFIPSENIKWTITAGGSTWTFQTTR